MDTETTKQAKRALRQRMRALRAALPPADKARMESEIHAALRRRLAHAPRTTRHEPRTLAVYLATPQEIDLAPFIRDMRAQGVVLVAPRWNGTGYDLAVLRGLDAACLRVGPMGVLEPKDADCVPAAAVREWIVPGLCFTRAGGRLGYGGGWYDRFLAAAPADARTFGVAFPFQIVDALPAEAHDRPLSEIVVAGMKCALDVDAATN